MDRRNFLSWMSVGMLASSLPVAIAACTPQKGGSDAQPQVNAPPRSDGFAVLGTVGKLDEAGFLADPKFAGGPVVVVRDPKNKDALVAVDSTCTHKGCVVDWKADQKTLLCPCHAAAFALDGKVQKGPANQPLKVRTAKIEGDSVLVKT